MPVMALPDSDQAVTMTSNGLQTLTLSGSAVAHVGNVYNTYNVDLPDVPGIIISMLDVPRFQDSR